MAEAFLPREAGCCGVYAVAEATGLPFATVFEIAKTVLGKRASWRGSTTDDERDRILAAIGATVVEVPSMKGQTLLEAAWPGYYDSSCNYIMCITGHVVTLKDGLYIDQCNRRHPLLFKYRHWTVKHAYAVTPMLADTGGLDELF